MTIDASVAHAIQHHLDIVEALPAVKTCKIEEMPQLVEGYVAEIQNRLTMAVARSREFLAVGDSEGLFHALQADCLPIPGHLLRRMCATIVEMAALDARFIADLPNGGSLYAVRLRV